MTGQAAPALGKQDPLQEADLGQFKQNQRQLPAAALYLACAVIYVTLVGLALFRVLNFESWGQVIELHTSSATMEMLSGHPHFFRYMVAYPGLRLADIYGDVGFSFYIVNVEALSIAVMFMLLRDRSAWIIVIACLAIFTIHLFMNGRGAISWFGWMAILYLIFNNDRVPTLVKWPVLLLALLCCSVSSGTFSVAFAAVIGWHLLALRWKTFVPTLLLFSVLAYAYWGLFLEGLERNLVFYTLGTGNPIINMLRHGAGALALDHPVLVVLAVTVFLVAALVIWMAMEKKPTKEELISLLTPLGGGVFGYTTLSLIIPSIIVVLSRRLGRRTFSVVSGRRGE